MTRPLVIVGAALSLTFALLVGGLRLQAQDTTVSSFFGGCTFPCWQAVQPGVTERAEALARLKPRGWMLEADCNPAVYDICYTFVEQNPDNIAYVFIAGGKVKQIALVNSGLTLGEMALAFGAPDYAAMPTNRSPAATFFASLWFGSVGVSARMSVACPAGYTDMLRTRVTTILVWEPGTAMRGDVLGTMADLRQTLRRLCGG